MRFRSLLGSGLVLVLLAVAGCGGDDENNDAAPTTGGTGGSSARGGSGGSGEAGAQGGDPGTTEPVQVDLNGSVQKGPFVEGSSVQVSTVDALGDPTGDVFNTQTDDDLGTFSLKLTYQGGISIEGNGYYYNEVLGELSASDLTLRAFCNVSTDSEQAAYVNILTHLTYGRVKALLEAGGEGAGGAGSTPAPGASGIPDEIIAQAEDELRASLGVGGPDFRPAVHHSEMNMVGGDNQGDAYLFAISVIFTEIARMNTEQGGGSLEAELQELINTASSEFAETGMLPSSVTSYITGVQQSLDIELIMDMLRGRLQEVNSGGTVPDLRRVWDSDADGVVDNDDNCERVANPEQDAVNDLCSYRRRVIGATYGDVVQIADFTNDGHQDILSAGGSGISVQVGDGTGVMTQPTEVVSALQGGVFNAFPNFLRPTVRDLNDDGNLDLVVNGGEGNGRTAVYWGDGSGAFSEPTMVVSTPIPYDVGSVSTLLHYAVLDVNADALPDFVGSIGSPEGNGLSELYVLFNQGDDTWGGALQIALPDPVKIGGIASADLDGDGNEDLVVSSYQFGSSAGGLYLLWGNGASSEPYFTVDPAVTSAGANPGEVVIGDVVGNAELDLVVGGIGLRIFSGDGSRVLGTPIEPAGIAEGQMAIGDVSGDGLNDIVLAGFNGIGALLGDGSNFTAATAISVGSQADVKTLATGDLNGDAKVDAVVKLTSYASLPFDCAAYLINPQ